MSKITALFNEGDRWELGDLKEFIDFDDLADFSYFISLFYRAILSSHCLFILLF